jgi:hypothetical protein
MRYPADPPTVDEIVTVMRRTRDDRHGWRLRATIVVLWRGCLRVQEALALAEHDRDERRSSVLVRHGKGGRRREVGMDEWGWEPMRPWPAARAELPVGPLFCIIDGPTRGRPWSGAAVRTEFRRVAARAVVRRRFAPHQPRHAHALELAREGVPRTSSSASSGTNVGTTSIYLQGSDPEEMLAVRARRTPMMSASAGLRLLSSIGKRERPGAPASPGPQAEAGVRECFSHALAGRPWRASRTRPRTRSLSREGKHGAACALCSFFTHWTSVRRFETGADASRYEGTLSSTPR